MRPVELRLRGQEKGWQHIHPCKQSAAIDELFLAEIRVIDSRRIGRNGIIGKIHNDSCVQPPVQRIANLRIDPDTELVIHKSKPKTTADKKILLPESCPGPFVCI